MLASDIEPPTVLRKGFDFGISESDLKLLGGDRECTTPTASTASFQGCADHLCQKRGCDECGGDLFKLHEYDFEDEDTLSREKYARVYELGWTPEAGNPTTYFDEDGDSLLHTAARSGMTEALGDLLQMGADVDICCQGCCCCSPLMVACRFCKLDCARLLLEHGASVEFVNGNGETALEQVTKRAIGTEQERALIIALLRGHQEGGTGGSDDLRVS